MFGIKNIRAVKGLGAINDAYDKVKKAKPEPDPDLPVTAKKPKAKKRVNKKSSNKKAVDRELKKLVPIFLAKNPICQIQSPVCTQQSTCAHHTKGRGKVDVLDVKKMKASCSPCNLWVEENDKKARDQGHKVSKF